MSVSSSSGFSSSSSAGGMPSAGGKGVISHLGKTYRVIGPVLHTETQEKFTCCKLLQSADDIYRIFPEASNGSNSPCKTDAFVLSKEAESLRKGTYQHYKNQLHYEVIGVAIDQEGNEFVYYRQLYDDRKEFVRPLTMFCENVEHNGRIVPRFAFVPERQACG